MKRAVFLSLTLSLMCVGSAQAQQKRPNIVVFWGDDIGQSNISAYSHGLMGYRTPNIDRVAKRAVDFIQRQHKAGKPFFIWINTTHMHFRTHTKPESLRKAGRWQSFYHDTMVDHDRNDHLQHLQRLANRTRLPGHPDADNRRQLLGEFQGVTTAPEGGELQPGRRASHHAGGPGGKVAGAARFEVDSVLG